MQTYRDISLSLYLCPYLYLHLHYEFTPVPPILTQHIRILDSPVLPIFINLFSDSGKPDSHYLQNIDVFAPARLMQQSSDHISCLRPPALGAAPLHLLPPGPWSCWQLLTIPHQDDDISLLAVVQFKP